ncbi:MAG TPA: NAD(P)/FAD-dependent oxidoreductase [Candidatus Krumholzibacteria bacterium]|nr:NAD(P)/FAD-dependent oxidoreductase [Candidatus Krumholzibacteria bacterium]
MNTASGVVIVGGGFGGLYAAKVLARAGARVTVVDQRNFHLFQPLLYQVATGGLSPGDIASPIRAVLRRGRRTRVIQAEAIDVRPNERVLHLRDHDPVTYDILIVATGSRTSYFGHDEWAETAPGLKTVEDAIHLRARVLSAFERAEVEEDAKQRENLLHFVVVGGGPTGVELAGAIAELARTTLSRDYRAFDPRRSTVMLVEAGQRILPAFPPELSAKAAVSLQRLGVVVRTGTMVTSVDANGVEVMRAENNERIDAATVLWAAGVTTTEFGDVVANRFGAERDRGRRIVVNDYLAIPGHDDVYVIGDLASAPGPRSQPLPGLAPVAMQEGAYVAKRILGRTDGPFRYRDKGQLAVIGRNAAVCDLGRARLSGFLAWLLWVFVHIGYLIEFDNKVLVMVQWAFAYITRNRGARLITGKPEAG